MIQLVSFRSGLNRRKRIEYTIDILNYATEPFVLFCGHTIFEKEDIIELKKRLTNRKVAALVEVRHVISSGFIDNSNCLYLVQGGNVINLFTNQHFASSDEIQNDEDLAERFMLELEQRRRFEIDGIRYLVLQCGEINILSNIQSEANKVVFRFPNRPDLAARFENLLAESDIILNPIHTPMGNQGKMHKRREYLSAQNRYYFSCCNTKPADRKNNIPEGSLLNKLQYAYHNGEPMIPTDVEITDDFLIQSF